ncbi:MAG: hypothetical protein IJQ72_03950 [Bacilli bacterium]|nr:hypothetical protein [Bacilli bacterium]
MKLTDEMIKICEIQASYFSSSIEDFTCGSRLFTFRFMNSKLAKLLDNPDYMSLYTPTNYKELLIKEYPGLNQKYGYKVDEPIMHWIGYIYRAISLLLHISSKHLLKKLPFADMVFLYKVHHTYGVEYCVNRINQEYQLVRTNSSEEKEIAKKVYKDLIMSLK